MTPSILVSLILERASVTCNTIHKLIDTVIFATFWNVPVINLIWKWKLEVSSFNIGIVRVAGIIGMIVSMLPSMILENFPAKLVKVEGGGREGRPT